MKIYLPNGEELLEVPVESTAEHEQELMKSDFIRLEWSQDKKTILPCGSYIVYEKDNVKYRLFENYEPDEKDLGEFDFSPEFQHPIMWLGNVPFIHIDGDITSFETADKETEWKYTGMAANLVQEKFVPYLNKVGETITDIGTGWSAIVSVDITATADCSFSSMDFLSALNHAASQYECEWHLDYENKILYFGTVSIKTTDLTFEVGVNVNNASITQNKDGYYNAFLAKGSTRNISQVNDKGENIQLNKRLTLDPVKYPKGYIDVRENDEEPLLMKELIFEDIYPSMNLYVYNPRARTRNLLDNDGNTISDRNGGLKRYSVWYVRLAYKLNGEWKDFEIDEEMLLGTLSCQFQPNTTSTKYTSSLTGRTFELKYHKENISYPADEAKGDTGVEILAGDYEIIFDQSNDLIIPTTIEGGLYPKGDVTPSEDGNILRLYNIAMPSDVMTQAQEELEKATLKEIDYYRSDRNNYSFNSNPIEFKKEMPELFLGREVNYRNGDYSYTTRIIKLVQKLDFDFEVEITVGNETIKGNTTTMREQLQILMSAYNTGSGGSMSVEDFRKMLNIYGGSMFLSKINSDTAQGLITFIKGLVAEGRITANEGIRIGDFVAGFIGGMGGMIDKDGNAELKSLRLREFLEVPELRNNRIDVVSGELWNSICFGTIESVDVKRRIAVLKLQDGELSGIKAGDICRGIFHCLEGSNPTESKEDECGFLQLAGFSTSYFTPTEVYDNGASFKYSLRQGTSVHPQVGMKFAVYGSFTDKTRRASAYMTRTYTRYLNNVDTWQIRPDVHIYGQQGDIEGLTINGVEMHGYGAYLHNLYLSGVHIEFDRDWIDHNIPKTYNVVLTTYERTVVTDIEGNPLTGLEEIRNIISEDGNVVSGESNVIANRLALTTTIQASKGSTPLLYSDIMDEGRFVVSLQCIGCTAKCENGVVMVTSLDMESMEHQVMIEVNCEGEAVYQQIFNVPVVKQGENGVTADLDNEMATIAANDKGKPIVEPFEEIVSHGRLWYGNDEMYLVKAEVAVPGGITVADVTRVTDEEGQHNYLPIADNKYCTLRITNVGEDAADISQIRIELFGRIKEQMNTEYSKVVVFTLNKVRMGENAQNYSLLTTSPIMQADGKGNVTTTQVACSVLASDGKSMTELTTAEELEEHALTMKVQLYNANDAVSEDVAYTIGTNLVVGTSTIGGLKLTKDSVRLVFLLYWQGLLIDKEGIPMIKDGSSTVRIDLDNENDSILYNDAGEKVSSDCYTNIKVYDGSKNVTSSCILSIDYGSYVSAYISGTQCYVTSVSSTTGYARIAAYYPADGNTYYAIFSIKRLVGEDKYEIVTSPTTVSYDPNKKEYSATSVKVDVYRTDQNGVRSIISSSNTLPSGYALQYSSDGSVWAAISAGSSVTPDYTLPNIFLRIVDNNGKVRDSETVPVVIGGSDSTSYWLISPVSAFSLSPSGSYTPSSFSVTMKKKTGEDEVDNCSDFYLSVWGVGSGGGIEYVSHKTEKSYEINVSQPSSNKSYTSLLVVASSDVPSSNNYPSKIVAEMGIGIVTDGKAGEAGKSIFLIDKGIFKPGQSYKFDKMEGVDNAYERDWVLHNPGGGSYYAYAVKSMGTTVDTAPSVAGGSDNNWEFLNKHESVLADTLIGVNCNIGGFAVTNEQFASQNYLTNNAGICINGKNGEIIAKQSSTSEWKVDTSGNMSIGNPSGQRIVVNPETRDIKVFDSSDNLVTTISGETVSSISNLFGFAGSISAVSSAVGFTIRGTGTIQTKKEYITISNYFSADAGAKLSASCSLYLSATPYTDTGDATKPQIMGNSISARIVYTDSYGNIYGALTGNFSVVGDIMSGGAGSNTLRGSAIVKSSGYYYVKLEVKYAVGAASLNLVAISNIENIGLSLVADNYLSRLLANGFCFGSTNANYIAALNESDGNMHFDFKSGKTQLELTNSNFVLKSQYGKVFPTILWAYCSSTSVRQYYTSTGGEPKRSSSSSSTGIFVLDISNCNFDTDLSPSNAIFTLTPILGNCRTMQIGNIDTSTPKLIPILSFDGNGNAADAWFTIQVQRII